MNIAHFKKLLEGNNGIRINDDLIVFKDFELYSLATNESTNYTSLEELIKNNKNVKNIITKANYFALRFDGGRGSSSSKEKMGGGFQTNNERGSYIGKELLNAELNYGTAGGNSIQAVLGRFKDKYGTAKREYGAAVDGLGYVHKLRQGGKSSVAISGNKGQTIIHNHPNGSNFSSTDLYTLATTDAKGVIATSSSPKINKTYHIRKNENFKAKDFVKAVRNAKWPTKYDYSKGADWWLKKNQRAFGYKYSSSKIID